MRLSLDFPAIPLYLHEYGNGQFKSNDFCFCLVVRLLMAASCHLTVIMAMSCHICEGGGVTRDPKSLADSVNSAQAYRSSDSRFLVVLQTLDPLTPWILGSFSPNKG